MNLQGLMLDIHALEQDLLRLERKYGVRSETFYAAYCAGDEPEDDAWVLDFAEWAGTYRAWLQRQAQYRNQLQVEQPNPPSLAGLVRLAS
ncbi:MAG: hypothetical protein NT029_12360 [Armatimonadetes bacterium]|nr:hypothetical protein [Armatimonadota bacterium]